MNSFGKRFTFGPRAYWTESYIEGNLINQFLPWETFPPMLVSTHFLFELETRTGRTGKIRNASYWDGCIIVKQMWLLKSRYRLWREIKAMYSLWCTVKGWAVLTGTALWNQRISISISGADDLIRHFSTALAPSLIFTRSTTASTSGSSTYM